MSTLDWIICSMVIATVLGMLGYAAWTMHRDHQPAGYRTFYYSRRKGIHDGIAHAGWCLSRDGCETMSLPVRRDGSIIPASPPTGHR